MLPQQNLPIIPTHWGTFRVETAKGSLREIQAAFGTKTRFWEDIQSVLDSDLRIRQPAVRKSFLDRGEAAYTGKRGEEPFVSVTWETALDLAAHHLSRVKRCHGNEAIFGGSYGWSSAGRFHHAQSQVHRFLNSIGGYTKHVNSYSYGAAEVMLPHVIGGLYGLTKGNTPWSSIEEATELIVAFGGLSRKNAQSNPGGVSDHHFDNAVDRLEKRGIQIVSISPIGDDSPRNFTWLPIVPNTDVPLMLALAFVLAKEGLADRGFLERYSVGYEQFEAYILGSSDGLPKDPSWASTVCGIDAADIITLARQMASRRTMIMVSWSLQRAENGEHPYWLAITLAAMIGQIGQPGCGFGFGYAAINSVGHDEVPFPLPSLSQLENRVETFIPVARIADMLLQPKAQYRYNGQTLTYPDVKLIYWAGGNPFHHHQDLNRLRKAWAKPEVVIVNEIWWNGSARHADIVFPTTLQFERNDIVCTKGSQHIFAAGKVIDCPVNARPDYEIFAQLAARLGSYDEFTEGRNEEEWLRYLYSLARGAAFSNEVTLPEFDDFWASGFVKIDHMKKAPPLFQSFRRDPIGAGLATPSGKIEIFSETIASFNLDANPGHPVWIAPSEWLRSENASAYPLHLLSNQPSTKLHSQFDHSPHSRSNQIKDREPIRIHPDDARKRGIRQDDIVKVFNDRGAFLAAASISKELVRGVVQIATGAWLDIIHGGEYSGLEIHGNPNVVTSDRPTSEIAQGCAANSCLVEIARFDAPAPQLSCYSPPRFESADAPPRTSSTCCLSGL